MLLGLAPVVHAAEVVHPAQALLERAAAQVRTDPIASSRAAHAALELLIARPDVDLEIQIRTLLCDHLTERDQRAAEAQIARARAVLPRARRQALEAGVLTCEGTMLEMAGDNDAAASRYDQAVALALRHADDEMLALALFARGYLSGLRGQYAAGLADLKRAHGLFEQVKAADRALTTLNSIAILYTRMGDFEQARQIYERALQAQRGAGLRRDVVATLYNLGRTHENLQQWNAARRVFQQALEISRELQYARGEAYALRGLAAVSNAHGDHDAALFTLERAGELQHQTPDARLHAQIQLARGVALRAMKQLPASAAALQDALAVFADAASLHELHATYDELAELAADQGEWREAYQYRVRAQQTAEQMFRSQIDQRFATLKVEFDTAAKENENAMLLRENRINQHALQQERRARGLQAVVILLTVALVALLAVIAVYQWRTTHRMRALAMTDELTGVPNRRAVLARLEPLLAARTSCAMLIIDIDHFKSINDQHGHPEGDEALKLVAAALRSAVQEPAFVGRMGGEEFIAVLPGMDLDDAGELAQEFRARISALDGRPWLAGRRMTISVGATTSAVGGDTSSAMLLRADTALYEAKRAGRDRVIKSPPPASHIPIEPTQDPPAGQIAEYA